MFLMDHSSPPPRRLRAALIALGFDSDDEGEERLTRGQQSLILGGSHETHAELRATALRMEQELERRGQRLGDLDPKELADLATTIGSPELYEFALRMQASLERQGRAFADLTAEELTGLSMASARQGVN